MAVFFLYLKFDTEDVTDGRRDTTSRRDHAVRLTVSAKRGAAMTRRKRWPCIP